MLSYKSRLGALCASALLGTRRDSFCRNSERGGRGASGMAGSTRLVTLKGRHKGKAWSRDMAPRMPSPLKQADALMLTAFWKNPLIGPLSQDTRRTLALSQHLKRVTSLEEISYKTKDITDILGIAETHFHLRQ